MPQNGVCAVHNRACCCALSRGRDCASQDLSHAYPLTHLPHVMCAAQAFDPDCVSGPLPPHLATGGLGGPGEDKPHVVSAHDVDKVGRGREGPSRLHVCPCACACMYVRLGVQSLWGLPGLYAQHTGACYHTVGVGKVGMRQGRAMQNRDASRQAWEHEQA